MQWKPEREVEDEENETKSPHDGPETYRRAQYFPRRIMYAGHDK